ncbi:MAG: SIS domain-containing protein [Kordiimonas sp.]
MSKYLNIEETDLQKQNGYWTAREIAQQPAMWAETAQSIEGERTTIEAWLKPILNEKSLRIILTGAGTSAYAGKALAPHLTKELGRSVEAISTTDIVSNPDQFLLRDIPTLLVSYARSGNSPESVAACKLADQMLDSSFHLIITCNKDSALSAHAAQSDNGYCLLMPEPTLDQSFAMTSSFSSMMLATLCVFTPDHTQLSQVIERTETLLVEELDNTQEQAHSSFNRIVFLGSGGLLGIATEAMLKMLELTAGKIDCYAESPLGFRHGPKFTINRNTMLVFLNSGDEYRAQYDNDLLKEVIKDRQTDHIYSPDDIVSLAGSTLGDAWLAFPYIVYCQLLAFYKSMSLGLTPDNPCPSGEVNRVVQGVKIYPFES